MRAAILALVAACAVLGAAETRIEADITTSKGVIRVALFADECPRTVANFLDLAEGSKDFVDNDGKVGHRPFYDGLAFHRVIKGFMIQGGCPKGDGTGGPGYAFGDEISAKALGLDKESVLLPGDAVNPRAASSMDAFSALVVRPALEAKVGRGASPEQMQAALPAVLPDLRAWTLRRLYERIGYRYDDALPGSHAPKRGSLAMANSGPGTNGSQFFINLGDTPHLAGKHTVFGEVVAGMEVLDAIGAVATGPGDRPLEPVVIRSIRRAGVPAPAAAASAAAPR